MRVALEKPSAAGSLLRIQADVSPVVADMVAWAIMSNPNQLQRLIDAYLTEKSIEEGTGKYVRIIRRPIRTSKIVVHEDALDKLIVATIMQKAIINFGPQQNG